MQYYYSSLGEKVELESASEIGLELRKNGSIKVQQPSCRTNLSKVYAGGDAVTGPATVSEAMGLARQAAEAIDIDLMKEKRFHRLFRDFKYKDEVIPEPEGGKKIDPKKLAVKERVFKLPGSFSPDIPAKKLCRKRPAVYGVMLNATKSKIIERIQWKQR